MRCRVAEDDGFSKGKKSFQLEFLKLHSEKDPKIMPRLEVGCDRALRREKKIGTPKVGRENINVVFIRPVYAE